ncbi:MAG: pyridoxine 5'-phosphate synthase [Puniceicoccales bacterium]|jgi:pyridoxine 5-phosphate synthase|nr:pyridoxine 5'-phosphate synthase [Puniceicoccales bacterium]
MARSEILLGVNVDHAATLRQARYRGEPSPAAGDAEPDPLLFALLAEQAGADSITAHLREDRRHMQERDIRRLREAARTRLNLEMACEESIVALAEELRPANVCLVPENRREVTTEGGLDVAANLSRVTEIVARLGAVGVVVSVFIDPEPEQVAAACAAGAPSVELHTGAFANAWREPSARGRELLRLRRAAETASELDLIVNAGHGINYENVREIVRVPHLNELNIGHSIVSRALLTGVAEAVREMKARIRA